MEFEIKSYPLEQTDFDRSIEKLLQQSYVDAGFTSPEIAERIFSIGEVKKRGTILLGITKTEVVAGMIVLGNAHNPYRQIANSHEAEMQLLATLPIYRKNGIADRLCRDFETEAKKSGLSGAVLSTQPAMKAAHALYEKCGYIRNPMRDWNKNGREFWVYEKKLG
ncbi:GNAT family N-acetyltransferase [Leptospira gomenensis]|uniref:GNAT family N-acetyltransferase n=1 Tax=Leptospira gomenensis TaxID=2484974 RepID=A0A5F1YGH2_9LEPT|nr:GNAT family N-acetyltransferase [Leptospira gomenensis]TGK37529.1 GNAT family N-acetyltransferase [Leptospira gomenensis]TGK39465.1 GNAT family N-acetyltransferase [Leptospira gomenensis]TGK43113.1 GNAT family N-acetyltransferase [Leptospira gomenensis]TGK55058.1 GNAT family N-acetyltransferase [Leptospira gomenensis]